MVQACRHVQPRGGSPVVDLDGGVVMNAIRFEFPKTGLIAMTDNGAVYIPPMPVTAEMIQWKEQAEKVINSAVNATEINEAVKEAVIYGAGVVHVRHHQVSDEGDASREEHRGS